MKVREINPRDLEVIKYDGTNLDAVKQFIEKDCATEIYREGQYDGNPCLDVSGGYTLFLNEGMYIVQHLDLYGYPDGFNVYDNYDTLQQDYIIVTLGKE